ncbi:hypothetical protein SAMN00768000_3697 [Sulfobacillus thermosulfidooxidans DSM 9293]|uniref:Uncharacterized protein n=1 Tax=Sulfobacillus thermosulfidooxidans (strain DSM 9293 / VKM B-1269 / AT-1) TaxID=929705 RepID=A0A1W1WPM4_SULTA|nr:hypothetical protein SAMN00768000_3697 [Sulfobacillus thermosulfidooxidans DSM 9293]
MMSREKPRRTKNTGRLCREHDVIVSRKIVVNGVEMTSSTHGKAMQSKQYQGFPHDVIQ